MNCSNNGSATAPSPSAEIFANWEFWIDISMDILVVYITLCQIFVFITKRLYKIHFQTITDVLLASNLQSVVSFFFIVAGLIGMSKITAAILHWFAHTAATYTTNVLLSGYSYVSVYLILWLRQTMFHNEPTLKHLSSKFLHIFSNFQGCFIILCGLCMGIGVGYEGISKNVTSLKCLPRYIIIIIILVQIETELSMLLLFLIPMIRHNRYMNKSVSNYNPPAKLMRLMKRSIIVTAVAVFSDITAFGVFYLSGSEFFYHCNIAINLICVLLCFADWQERMFPLISISKSDQRGRSNTGRSSTYEFQTSERAV